ncbi:MAG: ParB/RepB/Spo0J family partition protein [Chloroflexota bacterium]
MTRNTTTPTTGGRSAAPAVAIKKGRGTNSPGGEVRLVPLKDIRLDARNPRTDGAEGLDDLAASLGGAGLVQPPILVPNKNGYRVLVGERRVRAARQAGLKEIACLVSAPLDPLAAHRARVVENLHRRELNPLDHALALRVSWLLANAERLGAGEQARRCPDPGGGPSSAGGFGASGGDRGAVAAHAASHLRQEPGGCGRRAGARGCPAGTCQPEHHAPLRHAGRTRPGTGGGEAGVKRGDDARDVAKAFSERNLPASIRWKQQRG